MKRPQHPAAAERGAQRLSLKQLRAWEARGYGMFIHFGMSTFDGQELSRGDKPSTAYRPDRLDVDQWLSVARDAGMKYAVLTTKHVAGHCLWPTKLTDYHVGTSGNKTDVVAAFVNACRQRGILPGFYYCSWDNHHRFGSLTPSFTKWGEAYTTAAYREFQWRQLEELLTQYGEVGEVCDPIGKEWFHVAGDQPRSDAELLGMYLVTRSRGANLLLDVGPDQHGLIPKRYVTALMRLRRNIDRF